MIRKLNPNDQLCIYPSINIYINSKDTLSKTVTGLTKGKTYYVRIQTFRKVSGKTYWSSWSKAKKIKITK